MLNFIILEIGQTISITGSRMTAFAVTLWVWELTNQATALTLFAFFSLIPQVIMSLFAGIIVDRWNPKYLIMIGETVNGLLTIIILLLYTTHNLELWHLYLAITVKGTFEQFQELAYSASVSMIVPKHQYNRASSIGFLASSISNTIAPALAGTLYGVVGFFGILIIDITTFVIAISTVLLVHIPQPTITEASTQSHRNLKQELYFGWHYVTARPSLLALLVSGSLFWFAYCLGSSLSSPLILARTGNDAKVLATVSSAGGLGGVIGALLMSVWGGSKPHIHRALLGMVGAGLGQTVFGLGVMPLTWIPAELCSSINLPILRSANYTIWLTKIKPEIHGRVFATRSLFLLVASAVATLIAGPLADYVFEPAMMPNGSLAPMFGWIFGTGKGAGIAPLYVICSLCMLLVGLGGYAFRTLRDIEIILPDYDASTE